MGLRHQLIRTAALMPRGPNRRALLAVLRPTRKASLVFRTPVEFLLDVDKVVALDWGGEPAYRVEGSAQIRRGPTADFVVVLLPKGSRAEVLRFESFKGVDRKWEGLYAPEVRELLETHGPRIIASAR